MLQTYYKREGIKQYFIIEDEGESILSPRTCYAKNLLSMTDIPGLLNAEERCIDNKIMRCYEMKGGTALSLILSKLKLTEEKIDNMVYDIASALISSSEYLLDYKDILWKTDYAFVDPSTCHLSFCYGFSEFKDAYPLKDFLSEILFQADKKEEAAFMKLMKLYNIVTEPEINLSNLKKLINEDTEKPQRTPHKYEDYQNANTLTSEDINHTDMYTEDDISTFFPENTTSDNNQTEADKNSIPLKIFIARLLLITSGIFCISLMALMATKVVSYKYVDYLILGFVILIVLTIINMKLVTEETPDEMMEDFLKEKETYDKLNEYDSYGLYENNNEYSNETMLLTEEMLNQRPDLLIEEDEITSLLMIPENKGYDDIDLEKDSVVLGTMKDTCDVILKERGISRMHAKIIKKDGRSYLIDLNSTNGTFLNGNEIESGHEYEILEGDRISFGKVDYKVTCK